MSNMSYCRFENTVADLTDCQDALEAILEHDLEDHDGQPISERERAAAIELVDRCLSIACLVADHCGGNLEEDGSVDLIEHSFPRILKGSAAKYNEALAEGAQDAGVSA